MPQNVFMSLHTGIIWWTLFYCCLRVLFNLICSLGIKTFTSVPGDSTWQNAESISIELWISNSVGVRVTWRDYWKHRLLGPHSRVSDSGDQDEAPKSAFSGNGDAFVHRPCLEDHYQEGHIIDAGTRVKILIPLSPPMKS